MNIHPNTYELGKEYRQRQENRAKKAQKVTSARMDKVKKSNSVVRLISQFIVNLK